MGCRSGNEYFEFSKVIISCLVFSTMQIKTTRGGVSHTMANQEDALPTASESTITPAHATTTPNFYDYEKQADPMELFKLGSDYCMDKASCSEWSYQTFPDTSCHCDKLCGVLEDCCGNYVHETISVLKKEQFACVPLSEITKNGDYGVNMVTECSSVWEHNITKQLCEEESTSDDLFLKLPVSDITELNVLYKNMYCAQCNFVFDFEYWKPEIKCPNETDVRSLPKITECDWFYIRPRPEVAHRTCQLQPPIISTCAETNREELTSSHKQCTDGKYTVTYDMEGRAYRNEYCAMCSYANTSSLFCELLESIPTDGEQTEPKKVYSFRILVDFNEGTVSQNDNISKIRMCKNNEKYDSFSQKCREIFCAPPSIAVQGICIVDITDTAKHSNTTHIRNCTMTKLDPSEYEFTNKSQVFVFLHQKVYTNAEFQMIGSDIYVCLDKRHACLSDCKTVMFQSDVVESYLSLAGLIISVVALTVTLTVYIAFPQLLNRPGKILICLVISLLLAQLLFLVSAEVEHLPQLCMTIGILVHYFFLSAFFWMNIVAFDLWMTFSNTFMVAGSTRNRKRFLRYNLYAWLVPLIVVSTAIVLDQTSVHAEFNNLKPGYGKGVCWISSQMAILLFFVGPLALCKLFDIVSFVFTAFHIARAKQQGSMATKKNACSFLINLKLSLIMGLTWVFAFLANATNETSMWYLFIIFNSLQGLFIAICFLCTKKVGRLFREKYDKFSSRSTPGTQLSSLS